jgi:hypothetical protein
MLRTDGLYFLLLAVYASIKSHESYRPVFDDRVTHWNMKNCEFFSLNVVISPAMTPAWPYMNGRIKYISAG